MRHRTHHGLAYGDWKFPDCINVEISSACNRSCYYCANVNGHQMFRKMSERLFTVVCSQLADMRWTGDVAFNYLNEPTLDKRLPAFALQLSKAVPTCRPILFSNGDFLKLDYVTTLLKSGIKHIYVTRHPPFDRDWDLRMEWIVRHFPRQVSFRTIEGSPWMTTWAGQIQLPQRLRPFVHGCDVITSNIQILADGRIQMCCCDSKQENIVGNITRNTILEIWRSDLFTALRKQARSGKPTNPTCIACYASREPSISPETNAANGRVGSNPAAL